METEDFVIQEAARGNIYKLLADLYRMPDQNLPEKVQELAEMLSLIFPEADGLIEQLKASCNPGDEIEQLKVDHARLFIGPFSLLAPPYGSVYLEEKRTLMGDSTLGALSMYRKGGVDIAPDFSDPPDHLSAELEFMYYLVFKEMESITEGDSVSSTNYLHMQRVFLKIHLGAWVSEFALNVERNAETGFYKNLAGLTKRFVRKDLKFSLPGV